MKKLLFIFIKINILSILYCISSLAVGPYPRIQSLEIDLLMMALEEA